MPGVPGAPGAEPRRHWLSLPSAFPAGGAGGVVACLPCRCGARGGGLPSLPSAYPAFGLPFCPLSPQPPSPPGKGVGGIGGRKSNQRQGRRTAKKASPPQGTTVAGIASAAGDKPPSGYHSGRDCKCRGRLNAGDARGEAPCIRKQKNLPLPRRGRGSGGMGAKRQTKGRVGGRQRGQAPRRVPLTPAETATPGTSPPPGTTAAGTVSAANGLMQGCRGRSPRRNKLKNLPLPTGKGGGGMGAGNQTKGRVGGRQSGQAPHRVPQWQG